MERCAVSYLHRVRWRVDKPRLRDCAAAVASADGGHGAGLLDGIPGAPPWVWDGWWWEAPCLKAMQEKGMEVVVPSRSPSGFPSDQGGVNEQKTLY